MALDFSQFGQVNEVPDASSDYSRFANLLGTQALASNQAGRDAAARADPFQPYKSAVAGALSRQLTDPNVFQSNAERVSAVANPFGEYKPEVAKALSNLLSNPGDVTTSPFYQFGRDQGIEAVTRANKGVDSGRYMADLLKFGTGYAGQQFTNLAKLYGDILGNGSAAGAAALSGQPERTAKLYNDILGGSSVGGAQMLMGGFGRAQSQEAASAGTRAIARNGGGSGAGGGGGSSVGDMLARYGINTGGSSAGMNGTGNASGISAPGNYGLPTGNMTLSPGSGSGSYSTDGGGGSFGGASTFAPGTGSWSSSGGGGGSFGQPSYSAPTDYADPFASTEDMWGGYGTAALPSASDYADFGYT